MKYFIFAVFFGFNIYSGYSQDDYQLQGAIFEFKELSHDFGDLNQGDKRVHIFEFTNIGNEELIIEDVHTQCGCTVPEWPNEPIPPGDTGQITVNYDSKDKEGFQRKVVTVKSNSLTPGKLKITANVLIN